MSTAGLNVRVLIIADDPLARAGLATLLADQPRCEVVGQVPTDSDLPIALEVYEPDVVVWDLGWDPEQSLERLAELVDEGPTVLALLPDEAYAEDTWTAGARGLLPREVTGESLVAALGAVVQGLAVFDPAFAAALPPSADIPPPPLVEDLTPRELEVLQWLAQGLSNKAIAYQLGISEHTVKFHVNAIMNKLGAQSRTEAAVRATRMGLIWL
jgi:two-component system nitrate/nitrite response regulator NarL